MKILFCDWNGTLLDDMPIWDKARQKTFRASGVEPPTLAEYFLELQSGDYLEVYRKRGITASRDELNAIYEPVYEAQLANAKLFPQVRKILRQLHEKNNIRLVLITAQQEALVSPLLDKFGIRSLFDDCLFHTLDKKTAITEIIQRYNVNLGDCSFIGDSPSDIRHAKKAGIITIAFLAGHIPENLLRETNANYYIRTFKEIATLI